MIRATGSNREGMSVGVDYSRAIARISPAQQDLHRNFTASALALKKDLVRTIYYLAMIREQNIHKMLGFRTIVEYAEEVAGFSRKQTKSFLSLARSLPEYARVRQALEKGEITLGKAQVIVQNTPASDQEAWIDRARNLPKKDLQNEMHGQLENNPGNTPSPSRKKKPGKVPHPHTHAGKTPLPKEPEYHHVNLKFTADQLARWATLMEHSSGDERKSREERILEALSGQTGGRTTEPPYLVVLLECPTCGKTGIPTNRGERPADEALIGASHCDATVEDESGDRRKTIPPRLRRQVLQRARYRCEAEKCQNTQFLEIHHRVPVSHGGSTELENLRVLCWKCHRQAHQADDAARQMLRMAPKRP